MNVLFYFVIVVHVIVCLFLIGVVLIQQGRSADLAGAFGGQGSQTAFGLVGPTGATGAGTKQHCPGGLHCRSHRPFELG